MEQIYPKRKRNRLEGYDYAQPNYYYVTVCAKDRKALFWEFPYRRGAHCAPAEISLSPIGEIVEQAIFNIPKIYKSVQIDKYVVMPNHIHLILIFQADACGRAMRAPTLSTVIGQMKGYATKKCGTPIWQKSFYDSVICSQKAYEEIWNYIDGNPLKWQDDEYYNKTATTKEIEKCTQI